MQLLAVFLQTLCMILPLVSVLCATTVQIWERRRRIPSTTYNDPLDHIFTEFDRDGDGHLTSEEVAGALRSRSVEVTPDQVMEFIRGECGVVLIRVCNGCGGGVVRCRCWGVSRCGMLVLSQFHRLYILVNSNVLL